MTDKRSLFVSQVIHERAEVLGIDRKRSTTKCAQTILDLEGAHATFKTSLKKASSESKKRGTAIYLLHYQTTTKPTNALMIVKQAKIFMAGFQTTS